MYMVLLLLPKGVFWHVHVGVTQSGVLACIWW